MGADSSLVVFDLDDTLIDTRGVLLPEALRRVSAVTGVPVARLDARGKRIEEVLAGMELDAAVREAAAAVWYAPDVPELDPLPGAREVLTALKGRVPLCLLTRGDPARQRRKIEQCGLAPFFERIVIRAIEQPGSKRDDLVALLEAYAVRPARCAVIGDDERDELRHARELGCLALKVPDTPLEQIPRILHSHGLF